ncbi:MAG: copper amine oxidase N-terminal domain-containing protein [Desulfotomaculaceae bacterium]|nr:copper amine oxidase N-terminal domain-containing protein [Desulfotomaculaceae bacterium]
MRNKKSRKFLSILVALSMLVTLCVPMAAFAGTTYEQVTTKGFNPDSDGAADLALGTFMINIDPIQGDSAALIEVLDAENARLEINDVDFENYTSGVGSLSVEPVDDKTFKVSLESLNNGEEYKGTITIKVDAKDCAEGDVKVKITKLSGQLSSGEVVVGKAASGEVAIEVISVPSITEEGGSVTFRLTESVAGAFEAGNESVKIVLPSGFSWRDADVSLLSGNVDLGSAYVGSNSRYLFLDVDKASTVKSVLDITADIVVDDSKAKYGDVNVSISGDSDIAPADLTIAVYAEYTVEVTEDDATTVVAGQLEQEIGTVVVQEGAPGSLFEKRTITLTLPTNARWYNVPKVETTKGIVLDDPVAIGTDGRILKYTVKKGSSGSEGGKIEFKKGKVHLAVNETGDFNIVVGGSAGVKGEATVATIEPAIKATANVAEVKIGMQNQAAGDIEIVEGKAEAINDGKDLLVVLPSGVDFQVTPDVEVVEGDLEIDDKNIDVDDNVLTIPVLGTSTKASKIKISGIEYKVDRTVAEGDVQVKIGGVAVNEVNDPDAIDDLYDSDADYDGLPFKPDIDDDNSGDFTIKETGIFPAVEWAARVVNAKCVTPAPSDASYETIFKIGDTKYTVNGVEKTMDVAPYISGDRTYLPIRYAAYAAGVVDANIMWNQADQSVILVKGDRVVKMVIGSSVMYINGVDFTMDVAPELVDPGRTMLPIRYVAQALGCEVEWDATTQSVTVK